MKKLFVFIMTAKLKQPLVFLFSIFMLMTIVEKANAQNIFDMLTQKAKQEINKKINEAIDPNKKPQQTPQKSNSEINVNKNTNNSSKASSSTALSYDKSINLSGKWIGTYKEIGKNWSYDLIMDLKQNEEQINGTAFIKPQGNSLSSVLFRIAGLIDKKTNSIYFSDKEVNEEKGGTTWCQKKYWGKISVINNVIAINGNVQNEDNKGFQEKKMIGNMTNCPSGTFNVQESANVDEAKKEVVSTPLNNTNQKQSNNVIKNTNCVIGNCENGYGKIVWPGDPSADYYEGNFKNHKKEGQGTFVYRDGTKYTGNFSNEVFLGLGTRTKDGLTNLAYWEGTEMANLKSLPFDVLKYHQDTSFAKLKKCNCLDKKTFALNTIGFGAVDYDVINTYSGKKVGSKTELEMVDKSADVNGFINNTNHKIFIRCYRKQYYKSRDATEYIDDSYIVYPGQEIMDNYRIKPQADEWLPRYFEDTFIYMGQYCDKNITVDCKNSPKYKNGVILTVSGAGAVCNRIIKKGNNITLIASGQVKLGGWAGYSTPEGIDGFESYSKIQDFKHGSLLAKFGDNGKWFVVDKNTSISADKDGKLFFLINDKDYLNNTGSYEVEIVIN